jgi:hypothetical protein
MQSAPASTAGSAASASHTPALLPSHDDVALHDLRREFGERWDIARITGGYRAVMRETGGRAPVVLYGRTSAELAESIRMTEIPT